MQPEFIAKRNRLLGSFYYLKAYMSCYILIQIWDCVASRFPSPELLKCSPFVTGRTAFVSILRCNWTSELDHTCWISYSCNSYIYIYTICVCVCVCIYIYNKVHYSFRNIGCLWVLSTSVYQLPRTFVRSSFYPLPWWPIFSCYS